MKLRFQRFVKWAATALFVAIVLQSAGCGGGGYSYGNGSSSGATAGGSTAGGTTSTAGGTTSTAGGTTSTAGGTTSTAGGTSGGGGTAVIVPLGASLTAINNNNLMVGLDVAGNGTFAVQDQVGSNFSALPPGQQGSSNGDNTAASCLNDAGLIGGFEDDFTSTGNGFLPVVWQNGVFTHLNVPPGTKATNDYAVNWINNKNQIVGVNQSGGNFQGNGFFWSSTSAQPKELSPAGFWPAMINDSGLAVGWVETSAKTEYFKINLGTSTTATDLGLSRGSVLGSVDAGSGLTQLGIVVNDSGTIVLTSGSSFNLIQISASGTKTQIGTGAIPQDINTQGDVVGSTTGFRAFIYTPSRGLVDMNKFVKPSAGITLVSAVSINNKGFVIAESQSVKGPQGPLAPTTPVLVELPAGSF